MTDNSYQSIGKPKTPQICPIHEVTYRGECPLCVKGTVLKKKDKKKEEVIQIEFKTCAKCGLTKPISKFWKNKSNKDGYNYMCIACGRQYQRDRRLEWSEAKKREITLDINKKRNGG